MEPMLRNDSRHRLRAFTLVEVLATVVVLAIAAVLAIPILSGRGEIDSQAAARRLLTDLAFAQADRGCRDRWSVACDHVRSARRHGVARRLGIGRRVARDPVARGRAAHRVRAAHGAGAGRRDRCGCVRRAVTAPDPPEQPLRPVRALNSDPSLPRDQSDVLRTPTNEVDDSVTEVFVCPVCDCHGIETSARSGLISARPIHLRCRCVSVPTRRCAHGSSRWPASRRIRGSRDRRGTSVVVHQDVGGASAGNLGTGRP